ncbi:hypothetical protein D7Y13_37315 [Corallococcus praedator]|uniref:Uncharacterized protein n=1 Tax=Corallococcus praedator TaxID=2316724 RepID=A0ABX9Q5S6_9BACT|nr:MULTISPECIES: hypothetical protein [Corallococcus]RKG98560.1 hypothetical protein D7X74_40125 [Corallococcus sp. CA047B]RKH19481.1 hypothetical protein D7X75_38675 [Corallococcus sp. CA031C]RKH92299.1 hypothetical protein D7Y13_37315 [Corallococcus praedator]
MDLDAWLGRLGLNPAPSSLEEIREALRVQTEQEHRSQGDGDTEWMRLCCVQLFHAGLLEDVLRIWRAKRASMDAAASIDVQFLCGAGLERTKESLASQASDEARKALRYLEECEAAGDFEDFTVAGYLKRCAAYYGTQP